MCSIYLIVIQLLEKGLDRSFADKIQNEIWAYFENQLISTVYFNSEKPAEEEEENIFVKLADCLIEGCENLSKSEVRNLFLSMLLILYYVILIYYVCTKFKWRNPYT